MGKLFIIPTPIGNLEDITLRALKVLGDVDRIVAEDTRRTGQLLKHYQISKPLFSNNNFNEHKVLSKIITELKENTNIALVSDAGTPGISDPGFLLIRECIKENIQVECLPGATAFVPALVMSGLATDRFCFEGFLPHKKGRTKRLKELQDESRTMIFYESPYRLLKTLTQFAEFFGEDRQCAVCRELTKVYEETIRMTLKGAIGYFSVGNVKGEFVVLVEGKSSKLEARSPKGEAGS